MEVHEFLESKLGADIKKKLTILIENGGIFDLIEEIVKDKMNEEIESELKESLGMKEFVPQSLTIEHISKLRELAHMAETNNNKNEVNIDKEIRLTKRNIRYCKNPLEKRNLEKRLNELYAERKKLWKTKENVTN